MERYHPALVVLHWLLAGLIILVLLSGGIIPLSIHLFTGLSITILIVTRFIMKLKTTPPPLPNANNNRISRIARSMHYGIYGLVFAVAGSGIGIAIQAELFQVLQNGSLLPDDLLQLPVRTMHVFLTNVLSVAVTAHACAAVFHQFVLKDQLFSRMCFRKREAGLKMPAVPAE